MRMILLAAFALTACGKGSLAAQTQPPTINPEEFLRKAVVEGLKEEGADRAFVEECIADKGSLFVLKCPICEPVRKGFLEYGRSLPGEKPVADPVGKGIPKGIVDDLKDPARPAQLKGIERLVDRYVTRHYERLGMSADDRKKMKAELEERKKEGMKMKELGPQKGFGDFCPSCNGAAKAK